MSATLTSFEYIYHQVEKEPATFEQWIVLRMLYDKAFCLRISPVLFVNHMGQPVAPMMMPQTRILAKAAIMYHQLNGHVGADMSLSFDHLYLCCVQCASVGSGAATPEAQAQAYEAFQFLHSILRIAKESWYAVVQYTTVATLRWLNETRAKEFLREAQTQGWESDFVTGCLQKERVFLRSLEQKQDTMQAFGAGFDFAGVMKEAFRCSIPVLNAKMGGGFFKGEACLIAGPSNSGKTVLAAQLMGEQALQQKKCLYVTTERTQPNRIIEAKIVSCLASIPYTKLQQGLQRTRLDSMEKSRLDALLSRFNPNSIQILHWWDLGVKDLAAGIRNAADEAAQRMGGLDSFVFDWIGATLSEDVKSDPAKVRLAYGIAADTFAAVTHELDLFGMIMAQAGAAKAKKVNLVGPEHLSENTQMHKEMPSMIGISGIESTDLTGDPTKSRLQPDQYLNVAKTRNGVGGGVPVQTEFQFQRFKTR